MRRITFKIKKDILFLYNYIKFCFYETCTTIEQNNLFNVFLIKEDASNLRS